jgi:hypothetical protein
MTDEKDLGRPGLTSSGRPASTTRGGSPENSQRAAFKAARCVAKIFARRRPMASSGDQIAL